MIELKPHFSSTPCLTVHLERVEIGKRQYKKKGLYLDFLKCNFTHTPGWCINEDFTFRVFIH